MWWPLVVIGDFLLGSLFTAASNVHNTPGKAFQEGRAYHGKSFSSYQELSQEDALSTTPTLGAVSETSPWKSKVLRSGLKRWLNPAKDSVTTVKILAGGCRNLLSFATAQEQPHKFPCLLKLPPTNLAWSAPFFSLFLPFVYGYRYHRENSQGCTQARLIIIPM